LRELRQAGSFCAAGAVGNDEAHFVDQRFQRQFSLAHASGTGSPFERQFIGEDFSPWTEKARWALDHHGIRYLFKPYQPLIDEPWLRLKTRNLTRKATVPVLASKRELLTDSFDIARWAEQHGDGSPLFPTGLENEIAKWNECSDRALRAGRALFFARLARDPAAQSDNLPPIVPQRLRKILRPTIALGLAYLRAKHGVNAVTIEQATDELSAQLSTLRQGLARGRYLLGAYSYADIAMAVVCQFVLPVNDPGMPLTSANRACWTCEPVAAAHQDIIGWRDWLYLHHRRPTLSTAASHPAWADS
jgi:glutathione S-transferase